jgi:hypothetical protein
MILGRNLNSQMVFYLVVKMTDQIVEWFANQKNHPSHVR